MIPLPVILSEFVMALGGALFFANAIALLRARAERRGEFSERSDATGAPPVAATKALTRMIVGVVILALGVAAFTVNLKK